MFPAALGRGAVRTTLAATKAIGGAYVGGVGNAGAVVKTVGNTVINSVRNSGGVGVYRRVAARDDKSTEFQVRLKRLHKLLFNYSYLRKFLS